MVDWERIKEKRPVPIYTITVGEFQFLLASLGGSNNCILYVEKPTEYKKNEQLLKAVIFQTLRESFSKMSEAECSSIRYEDKVFTRENLHTILY